MEKEPAELVQARDRLKKFEKFQKDPEGLVHLKTGISHLVNVIEGDQPPIYKERAKNLLRSYKGKVFSQIQKVLSDPSPSDQDHLWHWHCVMEEFTEAGVNDDQIFNSCHSQLLSKWFERFWQSLSLSDRELLKRQFQKKTATDD